MKQNELTEVQIKFVVKKLATLHRLTSALFEHLNGTTYASIASDVEEITDAVVKGVVYDLFDDDALEYYVRQKLKERCTGRHITSGRSKTCCEIAETISKLFEMSDMDATLQFQRNIDLDGLLELAFSHADGTGNDLFVKFAEDDALQSEPNED